MAFLKATSAIFLAMLVVFVKNAGPLQPKEEPKPKTIKAVDFKVPDKFTVHSGKAVLTISFKYSDSENKKEQDRSCMIFANPAGWHEKDTRLNENNFKGESVLQKLKELEKNEESTKQSREGLAKICAIDIEGTPTVFFDLVQGQNGEDSWSFVQNDVENMFNGIYVSKPSSA